jgi:tetratricopeptide (TPR) repeat protein
MEEQMDADKLRPLCFVLMPFGVKPDTGGFLIDFDTIYRELIVPGIRAAGLEPVRADEELTGGIIHKPMFERLLLCDYAVADLTTANANVFYELGVRHAARPCTTILISAEGRRLPFDVAPLRAVCYRLDATGKPADPEFKGKLAAFLEEARKATTDSPVYQLLDGIQPPDLASAVTDVFREQVEYSQSVKNRLADARERGVDAVEAVQSDLGNIADREAGVVVDLFLSYRAVKAWDRMIALAEKMPLPLRNTVLVQEQLAFALNRKGQGEQAERVLRQVLEKRGPSSETYGLLGRVYKDRWEAARTQGKELLAAGLLDKAIEAYLKGFEADWRDAYPGVNAVTLMEVRQPPDPRREQVRPTVDYAAERKIASGKPDYWDYATRLELAVLAKDETRAGSALSDALAAIRESWEPETTARNLRLISEARAQRGEDAAWIGPIVQELQSAASYTRSHDAKA